SSRCHFVRNICASYFRSVSSENCCVDETIAEKANCDCLIHFGDCCRTPTSELIPVLIIPRREPLDMEPLRSCLRKALNESTFNFAELRTLILDQRYAYLAVSAGLTLPCNGTALFIGSESCRLNLLTLQNPTVRIYLYDPQTMKIRRGNETVNAQLRRRMYLVEKAKEANVVGILIGSLTMKDRLKLLHRVREKAKLAKKKCYTFAVNRVTPPKLANFPEVDIFVYIGCPYSSLIDSSEFYKPIISPFEFDLACNPMAGWKPLDVLLSFLGTSEEGTTISLPFLFYNERTWKGLEDKVTDQEVHSVSKGRDGWAMGYVNEPD
ncbi:Diphthamide syn domain containing protein, partial [Trichuris trichiura]